MSNTNHKKEPKNSKLHWIEQDYEKFLDLLYQDEGSLPYSVIAERMGRSFGALVAKAREMAPDSHFGESFAGTILQERPLDRLRFIVRNQEDYDYRKFVFVRGTGTKPKPKTKQKKTKTYANIKNASKHRRRKTGETRLIDREKIFDFDPDGNMVPTSNYFLEEEKIGSTPHLDYESQGPAIQSDLRPLVISRSLAPGLEGFSQTVTMKTIETGLNVLVSLWQNLSDRDQENVINHLSQIGFSETSRGENLPF